jgi:hypothetical protein
LVQITFNQKFDTTSPIERASHKLKTKRATTSARSYAARSATRNGNTPRIEDEYYPCQPSHDVAHNLLHTYNELSSNENLKRTARLS